MSKQYPSDGLLSGDALAASPKAWTFLGMPVHRRIRTGQKEISWSAVFILSLVWFTWGFHIFAGGQALALTINRYTKDPRIVAFIQAINLIVMLGPFISYISDQIWTRLGRRRPFLLISWAGGGGAMFALAFLDPITAALNNVVGPVGVTITQLGLLALIVISYTTLWDLQAPLEPLFLECVPPHQRGRFFAVREIMFRIAVLIFWQVLWGRFNDKVDLLDGPRVIAFYVDYFGWFRDLGSLYMRGEQVIYILAGCLFLVTGAFLLFSIQETREPNAPNRKFLDLFRGQKVPAAAERDADSQRGATRGYQTDAAGRPVLPVLIAAVLVLLGLGDGYLHLTSSRPVDALMWTEWGVRLMPLLLGVFALICVIRRAPGAPAAVLIFLGARLLLHIAILACFLLLTEFVWSAEEVLRVVGLTVITVLGALYLLRSRAAVRAFSADPLQQLMRVPVASFMAQYLKDVFLTWSNYPFYIVLVIPGIQDQVWGNFGSLMQTNQFGYSLANQGFWGLPMTMLSIILLTPFSGWYSDLKAGGKWYMPRVLTWSWLTLLAIAGWFVVQVQLGPTFAAKEVTLDHVTGPGYLVLVGLLLVCIPLSRPVTRFLSNLQPGRALVLAVRHSMLVLSIACAGAWWWFYQQYAPSDRVELPVAWATFAVAFSAALATMFLLIWMTEVLLSFVGQTHARAWISTAAILLNLGVNIALFTSMRLSPGYVVPITLFMTLNVVNGSLGGVLSTFNAPMIYEYMPRSKMGTINAGRGLMGDGLKWFISILGGQWIFYYTRYTRYADQPTVDPEKMQYDYTSLYILMFVLFVPVLIAQGWFLWRVVTGKVKRWGVLEVEGEAAEGEAKPAAEEKEAVAVG